MSRGNLSGVYHFYTMAVTAATMIYIAYYTSKSGIWLVISRVASYFHEPKASANTAYE